MEGSCQTQPFFNPGNVQRGAQGLKSQMADAVAQGGRAFDPGPCSQPHL